MSTHPVSTTYLDVQVARASAALPAAGAFDTSPTVMRCPAFQKVTLFIEYTRGGAGGKVKVKIETSPVNTGDVWHMPDLYNPATPVAGADSVSPIQREYLEYGATGAAIEKHEIPVYLGGAVERLRIACAESGAVGTPGTCKITASFSV